MTTVSPRHIFMCRLLRSYGLNAFRFLSRPGARTVVFDVRGLNIICNFVPDRPLIRIGQWHSNGQENRWWRADGDWVGWEDSFCRELSLKLDGLFELCDLFVARH